MALRFDIGQLKPAKRRADGSLVAEGYLTRTGVFTYQNTDGSIRRELRLPEEVLHRDSIDSFNLVPVTDDHPAQGVHADMATSVVVGSVGQDVRGDGERVRGTLVIFDAKTITKMEKGKTQLSCGYSCDYDPSPGVWQGQSYDGIQRNIRGNHVALVDVGRAGPAIHVRMDGMMVSDEPGTGLAQKNWHSNCNSDKVNHMSLEELQKQLEIAAGQLAQEMARADGLAKELDATKKRADELEGKAEGFKARVDELEKNDRQDSSKTDEVIAENAALKSALEISEKARKDAEDPERFQRAVRARQDMISAASVVLGDPVTLTNLSDRDIMCAVVEKLQPNPPIDAKRSDDYVRARFDAAIDGHKNTSRAMARVAEVAAQNTVKREDALSARDAMIERNRNAWRTNKGAE